MIKILILDLRYISLVQILVYIEKYQPANEILVWADICLGHVSLQWNFNLDWCGFETYQPYYNNQRYIILIEILRRFSSKLINIWDMLAQRDS